MSHSSKLMSFWRASRVRIAVLSALALAPASPVFAAGTVTDTKGKQFLDNINKGLVGIVETVANLMQIVLGLGALVTLAIVIYNMFKGERDAASKIAWWVAALTVGFIAITVVKGMITSTSGVSI